MEILNPNKIIGPSAKQCQEFNNIKGNCRAAQFQSIAKAVGAVLGLPLFATACYP